MKNKLKYLLFLLCLALPAHNVWAYDNNTKFSNIQTKPSSHGQIRYGETLDGATAYNNYIYHVTNKNDSSEKYFAYCADPHLSASTNLGVDHILMEDDGSGYSKAMDFGLLQILKNGKWQYMSNPSTDAEIIDYEATSLAARMYLNGIASQNYRHTSKNVFRAYMGTLYSWINADAELKKYYTELTGNTNVTYIYTQYNYGDPKYYFFFDYGDHGRAVEAKAKNILKEGLKTAAEYKKGEIKELVHKVLKAGVVNLSQNNNTYEKLVIVSIELKNFTLTGDTPGYFYYQGLDSVSTSNTTVTELGYSFDYSTDSSIYVANGKLGATENLAQKLADKNKTMIYIAYKVVKTADGDDCSANFKINTEYSDPNLLNGAILVPQSDAGKDYTDGQRFIIYSNKPSVREEEIINLFCPSVCDPEIGIPQICDDGKTPDANGNVVYEYHEGRENGSYNVDKCIIENEDSAGNTYKLEDNKYAPLVSNNPYCAVYCKEEYKFVTPYKRNVVSGRYFNLEMEIQGQQDCYTTELNKTKYEQDINAAQQDIVNAYNEWLKYYELVNNELTDSGEDFTCYRGACQKYDDIDKETQEVVGYLCKKEGISSTTTKDKLQTEFVGTYYDFNSTTGKAEASDSKKPETVTYGKLNQDYWGNCVQQDGDCVYEMEVDCDILSSEDDYAAQKPGFEASLAAASENLKGAVDKLKQIVKMYNACVDDWKMVFLFDPEIKFDYEEPNPNGADKKYLDQDDCTGAMCNIMVPTSEKILSSTCDEEDQKTGKCSVANNVTTIFANESISTQEYCNSANVNSDTYKCTNPLSSITYDTKNYFSCTESEGSFTCGLTAYNVTNVTYAHKVATATGKYDTPRVFYSLNSSGTIKITTEPKDHNYNLVDGLPVGTNTPSGTYYYKLSINNLGRYFDSHRLGRIFGQNSTSISIAVRDEHKTTLDNQDLLGNDYACSYSVNQSCTDGEGIIHSPEECSKGEDWNSCKARLCPSTPAGKKCTDQNGVTHSVDECNVGEDWNSCKARLCPSTPADKKCTDQNGVTHSADECNVGEDWNSCKARLCPSQPGPDPDPDPDPDPGSDTTYCVKEAESYYVCNSQSFNKSTCQAMKSRDEAIANSQINYNCCPDCKVYCIGSCMYDLESEDGLMLEFRPITPAIPNPNNRPLGYNWNVNNPTNKLVAKKAENTLYEITTRANIDVENASDEQLEEIEAYSMKIKLTPEMATWIREYNDAAEENGSYNNDTLECYDYKMAPDEYTKETCENAGYTWKNNTCVMSNVFCYSKFIDELSEKFDEDVDAPNRDKAKTTAFKNYEKMNNLPQKETQIITNDYWTIYRYTTLYTEYSNIPLVGPSWK